MRRSRFKVKQAPTIGEFFRDCAALILIVGGLLYLHPL
jgi:hypothetical protein